MSNRVYIFILLICLSLSCGSSKSEYEYVYLDYFGKKLLYIFNNSEHYLCTENDLYSCQKQLISESYSDSNTHKPGKIIDLNKGYVYTLDDDFRIKVDYSKEIFSMSIAVGGKQIHYSSSLLIRPTYISEDFIGASQYTGFCDIKLIDDMIKSITQTIDLRKYGYYIDYISLTMNPDICKFASIINCFFSSGVMLDNSEDLSDEVLTYGASCIFTNIGDLLD